VPSESFASLYQDLLERDYAEDPASEVRRSIQKYAVAVEPVRHNRLIDACFSNPSIESIMQALSSGNDAWHAATHRLLMQKSPLSVKVTLAQLQKAKGLDLASCLGMDYVLVSHFMKGYDFYEGVRALLIDKDKQPLWNPASLDLVSDALVSSYFE
jgi:enoyl-CoA hydratase/carnithine racemase